MTMNAHVPCARSHLPRAWLLAVMGLILGPVPARAELITLGAARDNTLIQVPSAADPQFSNGSGPTFFVGRTNGADGTFRRRGLLFFDLAGLIPEGSVITSVSLTLQLTAGAGDTDTIGLHRLLANWGEGASFGSGGMGAPAQPPDATWFFSRFDTENWATPGGVFAPAASASAVVNAAGLYTWGSTPDLIVDAQRWLDNPEENFGWLLKGGESEAGNVHGFATRENGTAAGPRLTVEYTPPVPEPASLALLAAGALCVLGRRRRRP